MKTALIFILPLLNLILLSDSKQCHSEDQKALLKIKESFKTIPFYINNSWIPNTDCCSWPGIECDEKTHRISTFALVRDTQLSGEIPEAIGDLPYLKEIMIFKIPNLTGTIPRSITKLTNLRMLTVSWTNISGSIPSFLGQLTSLTTLDLSFNNLTGSIPSSLSRLRSLQGLRLDRNKLNGPIPESLGEFAPSLQYLYLSHNNLSGNVPRKWGDMNFVLVEMQRNRLQGDVSFLFGREKIIYYADFSRNMFEFDMSNMKFNNNIGVLDFNHNRIYGTLPQGLVELGNLQLNVSYNRLCGRIPVGGNLQESGYTAFFHNKCLCGAPLMQECK